MGILRRNPKKLSEEDLKLVPLIAQDLEMQLTNLLFPSEISSEYTLSEFNPLFEDQLNISNRNSNLEFQSKTLIFILLGTILGHIFKMEK